MASSENPLGHNDAFRKTWDKDEYAKKARDRILQEKEDSKKKLDPVERELLKARTEKVDLSSKLGKTVVVTKSAPSSQGPGYYCDVCDCIVKDSLNYLDHINGRKRFKEERLGSLMKCGIPRKAVSPSGVEACIIDNPHPKPSLDQRNLGMSMKVEKSTLDQVKKRFDHNKKMKEQKAKEYDYEQRMKELQSEEAAFQEYRREKRKERKRRQRGETADEDKEEEDDLDSGLDPEMASMMGFSSFGGTKRKC